MTGSEPDITSFPLLELTAHAKINLSLHVTGQRGDGYHLIDSLVVFGEFGDRITLQSNPQSAKPYTLEISGPFAGELSTTEDNLVSKAANMLVDIAQQQAIPIHPLTIMLEKNLPIASGIGGGSADAAATLLALRQIWMPDTPIDLIPLATQLGADVAMCLQSKPLRAEGIGNDITLLDTTGVLNLVLINSGDAVSTPEIFKHLGHKSNPPCFDKPVSAFPDIRALRQLRNDLCAPACKLVPIIGQMISILEATPACRLARMSGSGATCFGIYDTFEGAEAACTTIRTAHPDWWCVATRTTV